MGHRYQTILACNPEHASTASAVLQSAEALVSDIRVHHAQRRSSDYKCTMSMCVSREESRWSPHVAGGNKEEQKCASAPRFLVRQYWLLNKQMGGQAGLPVEGRTVV
eukprot:1161891-Pelagomonas_calceolata.AAC.2